MSFIKSFGQLPSNIETKQFESLPNFKNGRFQNIESTPSLAEGLSMWKVMLGFFKKHPNTEPTKPIPFIKTNLQLLDPNVNGLVWFGHSSYFLQIEGKKLLIDPVFSGNASPFSTSVKAFKGSNFYQAEDIPNLDALIITHDHWDHLDYKTVQKLKEKAPLVICGLGVAAHFLSWGWSKDKIIEKNWGDQVQLGANFVLTFTPARHFSGRTFKRNTSLFSSYVLQTPQFKIFLGGDSGYGNHFKTIGAQYGPFDLTILECGQYNEKWPYIHSLPEQIITECNDLNASVLLPVHNSKFRLAEHPWYEPLDRITQLAAQNNQSIVTPKIGEVLDLDNLSKKYPHWWLDYL